MTHRAQADTRLVVTLIGAQLVCNTGVGLLMKWLSLQGISAFDIVLFRGLGCFACALAYGVLKHQNLVPRAVGIQAARFAISGIALTMMAMVYELTSVSSAALMTKLDMPLLVLFGATVGYRSSPTQKRFSVLSLLSFAALMFAASREGVSLFPALLYGVIGCCVGVFGYGFLRKSYLRESLAATVMVPALACAAFGGIGRVLVSASAVPLWSYCPLLLLNGALMFFLYQSGAPLYARVSVVVAETPVLLVPILALPFEKLLFSVRYEWFYYLGVSMTAFLILSSLYSRRLTHRKTREIVTPLSPDLPTPAEAMKKAA